MKRSCDLEQAKELAAADRLVEFERKRRTAARVNSGGLGASSDEAYDILHFVYLSSKTQTATFFKAIKYYVCTMKIEKHQQP